MKPATATVTTGRPAGAPGDPLNHPVQFASAMAAGGEIVYTREDQLNSQAFEAVLCALEGGHAVLFASGMAAVTAVLETCAPAGVTTPPVAYTGTLASLRHRQQTRGLDLRTAATHEQWLAAAADSDLLWLESPTNPDLQILDIAGICAAGGATTVVDNTFATPLGQRPLDLGADVVIHSVSKYLAGHSDLILGAAVTKDPELAVRLREHRTLAGSIAGPMEAWLALRGVRTLDVRYRRAGANAAVLAQRLADHPRVAAVTWPGLPGDPGYDIAREQMLLPCPIISFRPVGGPAAAEHVCRATHLWIHATSLGGVESTLERRHEHTLESPLVPADLIRMSVGIEDVEDLWDDLAAALDSV